MARSKIALIGAGNIGGKLGPARRPEGARRRRAVRHRRGHAAGQGARPRAERRRSTASTPGSPAPRLRRRSPGADVVIITAGVPRKPGMSRDDLLAINARDHQQRRREHQEALPRRVRDRRLEPARRDGLRDEEGHRLPAQQGGRHGRRARLRRASALSCRGARRVGRGRHGVRARRPRRHDGAAHALHHGRRHPGARADRDGWTTQERSTRSSSARATAAARSSSCSKTGSAFYAPAAAAIADGRGLPQGPEARAPLRGASRRRVRRTRTSTSACRW